MLPDNHWEFVENSLLQVKDQGCSDIQWSVICGIGQFLLFCRDMFIDPSLRPQHSLLHRGMLDSIMDETDLPTEEMFIVRNYFTFIMGIWKPFNFLLLILFSIIGHGFNIIYLLEKKMKLC